LAYLPPIKGDAGDNIKIADIEDIGIEILKLRAAYHNPPKGERAVDVLLWGYLCGRSYHVKRQHNVYLYGSNKPHRIDFRFGGPNPIVLELAVRPAGGGSHLSGPNNQTELNKLCRVSQKEAKLRALLLIDLANEHWLRDDLKATYDPLHAGPGKFDRNPVRVIYVHLHNRFNFVWDPFK